MLRWVGSGGVGEGSGEVEVRITGGIVVRCGRYGLGLTGNDFMSGERGRVCFGPTLLTFPSPTSSCITFCPSLQCYFLRHAINPLLRCDISVEHNPFGLARLGSTAPCRVNMLSEEV